MKKVIVLLALILSIQPIDATILTNIDGNNPAPPTNLVVDNFTKTEVHLSWTASTTSNVFYVIYKNGRYFTTAKKTNITVSSLSPNTTYSFTVYAKKVGGGSSTASNTVTITTADDSNGNIVVASSNITTSSVKLSWTGIDPNRVEKYEVYFYRGAYRAGKNAFAMEPVASPTTSYNATNLNSNTIYSFRVRAKNIEGDFSEFSEPVTITTKNGGDTVAPPSNLVAFVTGNTTVHLGWTASTSSNIFYVLYKNGRYFATSKGTSYDVTGLRSGTTYSFKVFAKIRGGKSSVASNTVTIITENVQRAKPKSNLFSKSINVYPNPASEFLTINASESIKENLKIRLISITGKLILEKEINTSIQKSNKIDVSGVNSGLYFLEIDDQINFKQVKRIVIQ